TARPMDAFSVRYQKGKFLFTYQLGQLDIFKSGDSSSCFENRFFAGHRLDIELSKNLNIGLFETIIFGGSGRHIELTYLNPLIFFHSIQLNGQADDNTFLGCDAGYYIGNKHKIYGQLLIDDIQIEKKSVGDKEPNEIGYLIGFQSLGLFLSFDLQGEYLKITNRTYNQKYLRNRYINRGELIGHNFGSDGDRFTFSLIRWFKYSGRLALDLAYERRGEGGYDSPWTEPWRNMTVNYNEPFPTGTVEKKMSGSLGYAEFVGGHIYYDFKLGISSYQNFNHIQAKKRTTPSFAFRISLLLSTLLNIG
ncbi:MAG: hypothetical protein NTV06_03980, partial [candidate division Zixibacteria bacterium]|nr:hypothetical protein [candidate division Zixibacteria bacterium]